MSEPTIRYQCFVCDRTFQYGPHLYEGRVVQGWDRKMICNRCEDSNWDGIVPSEGLIGKFRKEGIKEEYNAQGGIIIPL
jgi:hypothetical protein